MISLLKGAWGSLGETGRIVLMVLVCALVGLVIALGGGERLLGLFGQ